MNRILDTRHSGIGKTSASSRFLLHEKKGGARPIDSESGDKEKRRIVILENVFSTRLRFNIRLKIVFIFDDLELGDIESRIITRMIVSDAKSLNSTIHKYININNTGHLQF